MKNIILGVLALLLLVTKVSHGGYYDSVIVPVPLSALRNDTMKEHVASIFAGAANDGLLAYKIKYYKNAANATYKSAGWMFFMNLSEVTKRKGTPKAYCSAGKPLLDDVRYYHVKYMLACTPNALSNINQELLAVFEGRLVTCEVKAYISKDRLKNYLYLNFSSDGKQLRYVFIIERSQFYQCISGART